MKKNEFGSAFKAAGVLALVLTVGLALESCDPNGGDSGSNKTVSTSSVAVSFNSLTTTGEPSTTLTLNFDKDIAGLDTADITLTAGSTGTQKGALTKVSDSTGIYELAVSDITSTGEITVQVAKAGYTITPESKTVTVSAATDGSSQEEAITLTSGAALREGSIDAGEVKWYKFTAESGTTYGVQWADRLQPSGADYTCDVKVSAFNSEGTAISGLQNSDSGYTTPKTLSGVSGTVYLKVEGYSASDSGTFAIRVYDSSSLPPQNVITISAVTATPVPTVVVVWNYASGVSGYRVYRSSSQAGDYAQVGSTTSALTYRYTDTTVSVGSTYWYKVAAYNANGEGEKSPAVSSGAVPDASAVTALSLGAELASGSITAGQVKWYKFTALSGTYRVQWADRLYGPESNPYTLGFAVVSAFNSTGAPITGLQNSTSGYTTPKTISSVSGTVYLKVEGYSASYSGTFAIRVY